MNIATAFCVAFVTSFAATLLAGGCGAASEDETGNPRVDGPAMPPPMLTATAAATPASEPQSREIDCACPEPWRAPWEMEIGIAESTTVDEAGEVVSPAIEMTSGSVTLSSEHDLLVRYEVDGTSVKVAYDALPNAR